MITAGANFIVLNAITAVSVSALVKGIFHINQKKEILANTLEGKQLQLIKAKQRLELEIENRKQTEKALLKSETKYRRIYNNILDVYYESSPDGIILEISPSIEKHSQYKREVLIGKSLYDIDTNPVDRDKLIEKILREGSVRDYELFLFDKDGARKITSLNIELIKDEKNNPVKLVGISRDIKEIKKTEHPRIINRIYSQEDTICVDIEDNGCGIPEQYLEDIFQPSFTLKGSQDETDSYKTGIKGTGYGMANVKKYIDHISKPCQNKDYVKSINKSLERSLAL